MTIFDFTVEETNLIAIYKAGTKTATLTLIAAALPDMDADMREIAASAYGKLVGLSEPEFVAIPFTPADDEDGV